METSVRDVLRLLVVGFLLLAGGMVAMKKYRSHQEKMDLVGRVRELTSESSFYRQFDSAGAERVLLQGVAALEDARMLGRPENELFDRVFQHDDKGRSKFDTVEDLPVREQLVRRTLVHARRVADELGLLQASPLKTLRDGHMPRIEGRKPVILTLIDPAISPGLGRIVPNLEIHPPGADAQPRQLDVVEVAAARELARDLASAAIIESSVEQRILERYKTPGPE